MPQIGPYAPNNAAQGAQGLIGPYSPGGGGGQSLIAQPPFSIDQLLDIVRRTTPPGFWQPLFAGNGLAGWNAIAAVLARVSLAVYNADQQSYILSATVGTPAVGSVTVTAIGVVPVTVPIPTGTIINYQPGSGAGLSYFVTTAPATLSAGTNTIVTLSVVSVVDGYNEGLPFGATTNTATGTVLAFGVNSPAAFQPTYNPAAAALVAVTLVAGTFAPGTPAGLNALGASRGIYQQANETVAAYRVRIRTPKNLDTPVAVLHAADAALAQFGAGITAEFQEPLGIPYPLSSNPGYIAPPAGMNLGLRVGFYDSGWFYDQGRGPGLAGTNSVGPLMDNFYPFFVITLPWVGGNPGNGFAFTDVYPFPPQGFLDVSFSDGAITTIPAALAAAVVYQSVVATKAGGVGWLLTFADGA